jgi:hypothetical protein
MASLMQDYIDPSLNTNQLLHFSIVEYQSVSAWHKLGGHPVDQLMISWSP